MGPLTLLTVVTTFKDNKLLTIGRGFIEDYKTILDGSENLLTIKEDKEENTHKNNF